MGRDRQHRHQEQVCSLFGGIGKAGSMCCASRADTATFCGSRRRNHPIEPTPTTQRPSVKRGALKASFEIVL
eukprot:2870658-Heterocapsa_arctica.AAC.1